MNYRRLFLKNGLVFLTIVTNNRIPILIKNIELLNQSYKNVILHYKFDLIAFCILSDHIHCIIKPSNIEDYSKIVKSFKYSFTKNFNVGLVNPTYKKLWQNRFWEHTIRDENDLNIHLNYIHYNPVKHKLVNNVKVWEYSSFHNFVENNVYDKNWGSITDIEKIKDLDFE